MRRKIEQKLAEWRRSPRCKPLIVNGARQVGKTYSILRFGGTAFDSTVTFDFSRDALAARLFDGDISPESLVPQLEALARQPIEAGRTLLFLDEVQACPKALTSLKYFSEQAPEYAVIAAGSLLGLSFGREEYSYPVGKVDMLDLHPMDFEEFLWAMGEERLASLVRECFDEAAPLGLHERALELYRSYLLVGGMPEAVALHADGASFDEIARAQGAIADAYVADMTKYASPLSSARILNVWRGVPRQLAKENHKFQYTTIASSARAHQYEAPIRWLEAAGIVSRCTRVGEGERPLAAFADDDFFKLYLADVGLLSAIYGVRPADLMPVADRASGLRGALAENYAMQQLVASGMKPYYWGSNGRAEVDFIMETTRCGVVPVEVKSSGNATARSMRAYRERYRPSVAVRLSARQFGREGDLMSVPLYAAFCLDQL